MRGISVLWLCAACAAAQDDPVRTGIEAFHAGEYKRAAEILRKARDTEAARVFLALAEAGLGECAAAAPALSAEFDGQGDRALRRLAGLALVQCRGDNAGSVLARLESLYPDDADVLYQSARFHQKAWNDAVYRMFQKTPASFRVNQVSAEIFEIQGRYAEAVSEYRKAIEKNPRALDLHFRLGRVLLLASHEPENLEKARREFEAELALNPSDVVTEYQIGVILAAQQKPDQAAARFERAVAARPDFAEALQALAKCRADAGRYADAIQLLEKTVALQPSNEGAHYSLMMAYRNAGRSADAARQEEALKKLQSAPAGEFTEFLKKLGEKTPKP